MQIENNLGLIQGSFVHYFNFMARLAHETARSKGWWDDRDKLLTVLQEHSPDLVEYAKNLQIATGIALKTSELSEALEGIREGTHDDKIPEFTSEEAEYADTIIRIMDTAAGRKLRVAEAVVAKMRMNSTRSAKHGGKAI